MNVPSICRLQLAETGATVGTGLLVAPEIILTSTVVVASATCAEKVCAVFFENTKGGPVCVKLLPQSYFFAASFPDYMDYCLVACESHTALSSVLPVYIPVTQKDWPELAEGDTVLVVQHIIGREGAETRKVAGAVNLAAGHGERSAARVTDPQLQVNTFEKILRCHSHVYYLQSNGTSRTAGCPTFNDTGALVGLQSQAHADGQGVVSRVLSVAAIARHLFAHGQLAHLPAPPGQCASVDDLFDTWYANTQDITRVLNMLVNFTRDTTVLGVTSRLCELATQPTLMSTFLTHKGVDVLLSSMKRFAEHASHVTVCLRSLWSISLSRPESLPSIAASDGVTRLLEALLHHPCDEPIVQLAVTLLNNISTLDAFTAEQMYVMWPAVYTALCRYRDAVPIQKSGFALLTTLLRRDADAAVVVKGLLRRDVLSRLCKLLTHADVHVFFVEILMEFVAELVSHNRAMDECYRAILEDAPEMAVVGVVIEVMQKNPNNLHILRDGNRALWGLGNVMVFRIAILSNSNYSVAFALSLPALYQSLHANESK